MLGDHEVAYELIKDTEPTTAQEYILKAIANAVIGQERNSVRQQLSNNDMSPLVSSA